MLVRATGFFWASLFQVGESIFKRSIPKNFHTFYTPKKSNERNKNPFKINGNLHSKLLIKSQKSH
jgi:hypothetical protein